MIRDANTLDAGSSLECDVCIVGAGAAGIAIALQFLRSNLRIVLLESGSRKPHAPTQKLYEAEITDHHLHSPGDRYRARRFGGSTTIWGGRCVPFDPLDFMHRPWVVNQNWPISYAEISRYYPRANELCEAGEYVYDATQAIIGGMRPMIRGFDAKHFSSNSIERFSCPTDFGTRYSHRLEASTNLQVLLNANCTEILTDPDGSKLERLNAQTLSGVTFTVKASQAVLATGGLENPRILLASRRNHSNGLGNGYGQVGRNYMCHIAGTIGSLKLDIPREDVWHGYEVARDGTYCRRRLTPRFPVQRDLEIASSVIRLHFPSIPNPAHGIGALSALYLAKPLIPYEYAKRLTGDGTVGDVRSWLKHVANVAMDAPQTASFLLHWLRRRTLAARKFPSVVVGSRANMFSLDYHAEQQPNEASRIGLSREVDQLGMPKLMIDWRYSRLDVHTAMETLRLLQEDFALWGHGKIEYNREQVEEQITRDGAYGGHHIGTTRMGMSAGMSVVDENCQVHGVQNLYIAGSAVFPTSSQANPTLTIVALALRLSDHLKKAAQTSGTERFLQGPTKSSQAAPAL